MDKYAIGYVNWDGESYTFTSCEFYPTPDAALTHFKQNYSYLSITGVFKVKPNLPALSYSEIEELINDEFFNEVIWNNIDLALSDWSFVKVDVKNIRSELLWWIKDVIKMKIDSIPTKPPTHYQH